MWIERADPDPSGRSGDLPQKSVEQTNLFNDPPRRQQLRYAADRGVQSCVNDSNAVAHAIQITEVGEIEHHGEVRYAARLGENFRVARILPAGQVQCRLAQGGCGNRVYPAGESCLRGGDEVRVCGTS